MSEIFREKLRNASKLSGERRKKEIGESKTQKQDENDMFKVGIIFVLFLFANSNSSKALYTSILGSVLVYDFWTPPPSINFVHDLIFCYLGLG